MDLQVPTSHLAAALMAGTNSYNNAQDQPAFAGGEDNKSEKSNKNDTAKEPSEEDKEDIGSGDEFTDEVSSGTLLGNSLGWWVRLGAESSNSAHWRDVWSLKKVFSKKNIVGTFHYQ